MAIEPMSTLRLDVDVSNTSPADSGTDKANRDNHSYKMTDLDVFWGGSFGGILDLLFFLGRLFGRFFGLGFSAISKIHT